MQNELLKLLTTKFLGVNENILNRVAKKLAETVKTAEEAKTAVEGVTFQQVLDSYGDARATDAQKTAVLNYEKKYNVKDGKPVDAQTIEQTSQTATQAGDSTPEWVKTLTDSVKALTDRMTVMEGEKLAASRKHRLDDILKDIPEINRKGYERISLDKLNDEEFSNLLTEITTEVGEMTKQNGAKGAVFGKPSVDGGKTSQHRTAVATKEEVDDVVNLMHL